MSGLPNPEPGHRWTIESPDEPVRQRRRVWPWLAAAVIVVVLCVAAWFAGNWLARDLVEQAIRGEVVDTLGLPEDQAVEVDVAGFVIPQLIVGSLDDVRVASDDIEFEELVGDVRVVAQGIPLRSEDPIDSIVGEIILDEEQLRGVLSTVDGFPAETVSLEAPDVAVSIQLSALGVTVPVAASLTPTAVDGDIVLEPATLSIGGAVASADDLRARFGSLADLALRSWDVCIAQWLPAGVTLTDLVVTARGSGDSVIATFDVDGGIARDEALQQTGVCA